MKIVSLICGIHLWWGVSLLIGIDLPRPFGALEPFFLISSNNMIVGSLLTIVGLLPLIASYLPRSIWCLSCFMIPQQLVLFWGFLAGVIDYVYTHDGRSWYALGYTGLLFIAHAWELRDEFISEIIHRKG